MFSLLAVVYCELNFLFLFIVFIYNIYNLWNMHLAASCNCLNFPNFRHPVERSCALDIKMLQFICLSYFSKILASSSL